jgi:hypothetical protein
LDLHIHITVEKARCACRWGQLRKYRKLFDPGERVKADWKGKAGRREKNRLLRKHLHELRVLLLESRDLPPFRGIQANMGKWGDKAGAPFRL